MKILIATGIYPPDVGGMATFVESFAKSFIAQGHGVFVVSYGDSSKQYTDNGVSVKIVSRSVGRFTRYFHFVSALWGFVRSCNFIFAQDLISSGFSAALVSLFSGKPLFLRLGGDFLWEQMVERGITSAPLAVYYDQPKSFGEKVYLLIYRFVLSRSRLTVFNSTFQRDLYTRVFGIAKEKTSIIENSMPQRSKMGEGNRGYIVFAGRFVRLKNVEMLISAYAKLHTQKKLLLIGAGPQKTVYKNLIERFALQQQIEMHSSVSNEELKRIISSAYIVVVPSLTEINPNVALEAIAVGTPVLITKYNGLSEKLNSELWQFDSMDEKELVLKFQDLLDPDKYEKYTRTIASLNLIHTRDDVFEKYLKLFSNYAHS